jgi:LmbE family N-acetylglucosaminyl deacetylase
MNHPIDQLINFKYPVYFISPHFDDAVLSAGSLLSQLVNKTPITVINVFTKCGLSHSLSAKSFLNQLGSTSSIHLYEQREIEDYKSLSSIGVKIINLPYVEALWRQKSLSSNLIKNIGKIFPELVNIYPTYRFHISSGKLSKNDYATIFNIAKDLQQLIPKKANVICLYGVGNHVDHIIVRRAVESFTKPIYMADQPYVMKNQTVFHELLSQGLKIHQLPTDDLKKNQLVQFYLSQTKGLFGSEKIPQIKEYILNTNE